MKIFFTKYFDAIDLQKNKADEGNYVCNFCKCLYLLLRQITHQRRTDWQSNLSLNLHQGSITLAKRRDYTLVRLYYGGTKTSHLEEEYTKLAHTFSRPRFLTFHLFTMLNHASHYHPPLLPSLRSRVLFLLFILFAWPIFFSRSPNAREEESKDVFLHIAPANHGVILFDDLFAEVGSLSLILT